MTNELIENEIIESILAKYKGDIGKHFSKYKNHVYRVFYLCQLLDDSQNNIEKYAVAAVFHDVGIWTDATFDYLKPSISVAVDYLKKEKKEYLIDEITLMINMHHKRSKYTGDFELTVETFRKADWVDVTYGMMVFNLNKKVIRKLRMKFPILGFHKFLLV